MIYGYEVLVKSHICTQAFSQLYTPGVYINSLSFLFRQLLHSWCLYTLAFAIILKRLTALILTGQLQDPFP